MEEEKVSSGSGMFDGVLNEVDDRVALELCEATETKVTCKKKFPNWNGKCLMKRMFYLSSNGQSNNTFWSKSWFPHWLNQQEEAF